MKLNKQLPDPFIKKIWDKLKKLDELENKVTEIDTNFDNNNAIVIEMNERLKYIEENLGTLTTEEYTCSGSVSFYAEDYNTVYQNVLFDRIFVEPPTVVVVFTYNQDSAFNVTNVSNITTSGCTVSARIACTSGRNCTVKWTAMGLVRKQTS